MPNYQAMLDELFEEMTRLLEAKNDIELRFERITAAIEAIETLAAQSNEPLMEPPPMHPDEERGFTDRVREILKANSLKRLTALEIRDVLVKSSPQDDPKIVLIHTHNTLKRLHKQDEVEETRIGDGRNAYQWKRPSFAEALGSLNAIEGLAAAGEQAISRKTIGQRHAERGKQQVGMTLPPEPPKAPKPPGIHYFGKK
jgi:hypothetical protein